MVLVLVVQATARRHVGHVRACWPGHVSVLASQDVTGHLITCSRHHMPTTRYARAATHTSPQAPPSLRTMLVTWFLGRSPLPVQRRPRTTKPSTSRYDAVHQPSNYDVVHQPLPRRPQAITIKVHQPLQRRPQATATTTRSTSHFAVVHQPRQRRPQATTTPSSISQPHRAIHAARRGASTPARARSS